MYKLVWVENNDPLKTQHEITGVVAWDCITKEDVESILKQFEEEYTMSSEEYDKIGCLIDKRDDFPNIQGLREIITEVLKDR